jgi:hypothetical protein
MPRGGAHMQNGNEMLVEDAYRIFSKYRIGDDLDFAAAVGVSDNDNQRMKKILRDTPLRLIPFEEIQAYFDYIDAAHYDGKFRPDEFRYFLPRALEFLVRNPADSVEWLRKCLKTGLSRCSAASQWPEVELAVVRQFGLCDAGRS